MKAKRLNGWAKTTKDNLPGLSVLDHCRNVGWVAYYLSQYKRPSIDGALPSSTECAFAASGHDIGKLSKAFQSKCISWLEQENLLDEAHRYRWFDLNANHGQLSQFTITNALVEDGFKKAVAQTWAIVAGAHHGKVFNPPHLDDTDDWEPHRRELYDTLKSEFGPSSNIPLNKQHPLLPWLMGLTSVADWIGSDEVFFPVNKGLDRIECAARARKALSAIGFERPRVIKGLSFKALFGFEPYPLQEKAIASIRGPGIYTIEAPMGLGKTEAALACAYTLMCRDEATGLYFALPTQVTSNRIHLRVQEFVDRIAPQSPSTRLVHANAWLEPKIHHPTPTFTYEKNTEDDARLSRQWFASSKRALLAPFGVGTVDQALQAVVAVKHWFVRRFALAGKVVVIDEVHSYDFYTGTLIRILCEKLAELGCTVILLSATLLPDIRARLLGSENQYTHNDPYPLITGKTSDSRQVDPVEADAPDRPPVKIGFKPLDTLFKDAVESASQGAKVLWVCNTVNQAQSVYRHLFHKYHATGIELGLLHSRFPFFRREQLEKYWLERIGPSAPNARGCILVSTQIVEQSVDLDADLLISELAPTDMMLQRLGRLWRHLDRRPPDSRPLPLQQMFIMQEDSRLEESTHLSSKEIEKLLGPKAKVYFPYVLLRTLAVWRKLDTINLPTDIRKLLQKTYTSIEHESETWDELYNCAYGEKMAEEMMAQMNSRTWSMIERKDKEGVHTRLQKLETTCLILSTAADSEQVKLLSGESIARNTEAFMIDSARAIHRNVVKVHDWPFDESAAPCPFKQYIHASHRIAVVTPDGRLEMEGLNTGISFFWDRHLGVSLTMEKGVNDESCD